MTATMLTREERRELIRRRVRHWAQRLNVRPRLVRVRRMTRKWGSCSTSGVVTLASDLVDTPAGFQDYVIAHELLHLRVPNHGKLFKALLAAQVPDWKRHDKERRQSTSVVSRSYCRISVSPLVRGKARPAGNGASHCPGAQRGHGPGEARPSGAGVARPRGVAAIRNTASIPCRLRLAGTRYARSDATI